MLEDIKKGFDNSYGNNYEKGIYDRGFAEGVVWEFSRIKEKIERYIDDPKKAEMIIDFIRDYREE